MEDIVKELLGKEIPCLDKGFVRLIDVMGDDSSIVQAARVSYGKGTKTVRQDRELIRYLLRHRHTSPFEMVELKFHVKLPIFVARQWIRHRTANVNEYSGRYSEMKDEFYLPAPDQLRIQSKTNRQGRSEEILPDEIASEILNQMKNTEEGLFKEYQGLLEKDLTRELARINLPLSTYTEWYWKIDLHNLFHFLKLRLEEHAQYEIRVYAEKIAEILKIIVPMSYEAFEDYILNSVTLSSAQISYIKSKLPDFDMKDEELAEYDLKGLEAWETSEKIKKFF
jgi:thymidylate synthase (FAD)